MNPSILTFITNNKIGVISVQLADSSLHAATVHYSHTVDPLRLYVQTTNTTVKVQPFLKGELGKAAFVIGFSEDEWVTLQMRGEVRIVSDEDELVQVRKIHFAKHPEAEKYVSSETVFMEFRPTWWRFTDFNTHPETVVSSPEGVY